jgi:hypothetical protein
MVKAKSGAKVLLFYETQVAMRKYIVSFPQNTAKNSLLGYFTALLRGGRKIGFLKLRGCAAHYIDEITPSCGARPIACIVEDILYLR